MKCDLCDVFKRAKVLSLVSKADMMEIWVSHKQFLGNEIISKVWIFTSFVQVGQTWQESGYEAGLEEC